jgi:integrase
VIQVRVGKTAAATRAVPIHPRLGDILGGYDGFEGVYLFNAPASNRFPDGQHHLNPRTVNVDYKNLAKQAGLVVGRKNQGMTFHALRRFFKTACLNAGVPLPLVDRWLGHSNKNDINSHYYRPTRAEETAWMSKVDFGDTTTP